MENEFKLYESKINPFSTGILWKIGITKKSKHPTLDASISKTKTNSE